MSKKTVVSQFEFAIRKIAEPKSLKNYRPITVEEENKNLENKIRDFVGRIKVKEIK